VDRHFLINAAPGSGKTIAACVIANELLERGEVDRVIVIAPRREVVGQWAKDFYAVTGRYMSKVTAADGDIAATGMDVCATWAAIQGLQSALQVVCNDARTLVICDEHHHAAVQAAWGDGADSAFKSAAFVLVLTGTPVRSDGERSVWLAYDDAGAIDHPDAGTYTLTYGEAVDLGYCRPVTFHRHAGRFTVDLEGGESVTVTSETPPTLNPELARIPGLQRALTFYKLACTPQFERDGSTPLRTGYQATMLESAGAKLTELRHRMPKAGGLVIAPSIEMAEYFSRLITELEGAAPLVVHSQMPNPESKISAFRNTDRRWLVSVAMVSEGVDIPRLRVLVYLPAALTELAFRQAVGRVVRTDGPEDDTRAYVVVPSFDTFDIYARRVEDEMPASAKVVPEPPRTKRCPCCANECELAATTCPCCEHEFPAQAARVKPCPSCRTLNSVAAVCCIQCGASFSPEFVLTLDDALREGAIVRGMDIDEADVRESERIAPLVRGRVLRSGDQNLIRVLRTLPDESWSRLQTILTST
jgi:superfamily II DNA or RNA helicase